MKGIGRLTRVDLRELWPHEGRDFTTPPRRPSSRNSAPSTTRPTRLRWSSAGN